MSINEKSIFKNKILYFDMDDTLIDTQKFYDYINESCCSLIQFFSTERIERDTIMNKKTELDLKNVKKLGFSPDRFPLTWKETYHHFISSSSQKEEEIIIAQARQVFTSVVPLIEHTETVLKSLKTTAKEMHLFTAGDVIIQKKRLVDSGLFELFDEIHIVPLKTPEVMRSVILNPNESVMIGNSLKSDIMPALANSITAVHIERKTWAYDEQKINESDENYIQLDSFIELSTI